VVSLFCRHNRFTADCPICSRGTVLDTKTTAPGRAGSRSGGPTPTKTETRPDGRASKPKAKGAVTVRGPSASAGPYERDGETYEVRLERVPGGLRLAEWSSGQLRASAPMLRAGDVRHLIRDASGSGVLEPSQDEELARALAEPSGGLAPTEVSSAPAESGAAGYGASPGRSGELRDELRVERLDGGRLRFARWVFRPGTGWDLLDSPTMLPAGRYAEALADAARQGLIEP
jgi:hypothetical protein